MASTKKEKYIIPASAKRAETQKGMKSIDNKRMKDKKILSIIILILHALERNSN